MTFSFNNTYAHKLPGFYAECAPEKISQPELAYLNTSLAGELNLQLGNDSSALAALFSGQQLPEGAEPIAQVYAGHQFGHFNPQLGDGRALIIGEVLNNKNQRFDIAFKGSGLTPFSRGGDGKAALGPMLREVLISECLHALGIPTTRSLAVVTTGEPVYREEVLPGAILTRTASSHIRIGTFEFFAARGELEKLKQLADYTIARHDPKLKDAENPYLELLNAVIKRQAHLIAQWMSVGFIHGVMNTDNMTISGESIDYGPCAFMERYQPDAVFSSIDEYGRYAYQNQPRIAHWNLSRLAQALLPLFVEEFDKNQQQAIDLANDALDQFFAHYQEQWMLTMLGKLGLSRKTQLLDDKPLIDAWLELLEEQQVDFTLAWRYLCNAVEGDHGRLYTLFTDTNALDNWLNQWQARISEEENQQADTRAKSMRQINPWIIARNHQVEAALAAASDNHDFAPFEQLLSAIQNPWEETSDLEEYAQAGPTAFTQGYKTFCGT